MKILLATLCLNESEWLDKLYLQHREWPDVVAWVFVEAADAVFAATNPTRVSSRGLSVDGTSDLLGDLADRDPRVSYIPHGISSHPKHPDQGKCAARSRYLEVAEEVRPDFVMVLDADEFYSYSSQSRITERLKRATPNEYSFTFKQRHIWRSLRSQDDSKPPSLLDEDLRISSESPHLPLFSQEVTGGYWDVPHTRGWRWESGMTYLANHNWPQDTSGRLMTQRGRQYRGDREGGSPYCVHMGYASSGVSRRAKHAYYEARGEGKEGGRIGRTRTMYVECRRAYEYWAPGDILPHGARVIPYTGEVPECFTSNTTEVASVR